MQEIILDAAKWKSDDDVYDSFFAAVGAPPWHGKNLNALNDSIVGGQVNKIEVPYRIVIRNYEQVGAGARQMAESFAHLIRELSERDTRVEIDVHTSE